MVYLRLAAQLSAALVGGKKGRRHRGGSGRRAGTAVV